MSTIRTDTSTFDIANSTYLRYQPPPELSCQTLMCDRSPNAASVLNTNTSELLRWKVGLSGSFKCRMSVSPLSPKMSMKYIWTWQTSVHIGLCYNKRKYERKTLAKQSSIADETLEICLSNKMFNLLATYQNIARQKFSAGDKKHYQVILRVRQSFITCPNGQTLLGEQISNVWCKDFGAKDDWPLEQTREIK